MSPAAKIAIGGGIGGLMLAVAVVSALHRPPEPAVTILVPEDEAAAARQDDLARCRTITMPESSCDAAWEARRRHFFGKDNRP
ncbi:putative entry exclusion protein TrbK-alt [Novosphingobium sp. B1]|uniref:putative entry exclusion protein TrbK-alt n=1 Tax=Novosphingobium sp. B1 TaxID=1938756 RepID=UPI0009D8F3E3|nr:putative entry exclusion protein TrbK-alt [Novosphingobium sp. B1]SMC34763.1 conjugative transfer region protein TrbK [Novosphingobium sp. B1]